MNSPRGSTLQPLCRLERMPKKVLGLLVALFALLPAAPAEAGTYTYYSCRLPDGERAPAVGWTSVAGYQNASNPVSDCGSTGLTVGLVGDRDQPVGARMSWVFTPPLDTTLQSFTVWRSMSAIAAPEYNSSPGNMITWPDDPITSAHDSCFAVSHCTATGSSGSWDAAGNVFNSGEIADATHVYFTTMCGGITGWTCPARSSSPMSQMRVHAFRAYLDDSSAPDVKSVGGSLVATGTNSGRRSLSVRATDVGSGVYRALVEVRRAGQPSFDVLKAQVVDDNEGRCAPLDFDPSTQYEFKYPVPCKLSASGDLDLDSTKLPDGDHELRVVVEDASGNRSIAYGPAPFIVHNGPSSPSGSGSGTSTRYSAGVTASGAPIDGARIVLRSKRTQKLRYGRRKTIRGRLVNGDRSAIRGATVGVSRKIRRRGASRKRVARVRTGARGRFSYVAPVGMSRSLRFAYRSKPQTKPVTAAVRMLVRAKMSLRARSTHVRPYGTMQLRGRLFGKSLPKKGALIDVQVLDGRKFRTVAVRRARGGRIRFDYRFKRTAHATFKIRAVMRSQAGVALTASKSRVVTVQVG